MGCSSLVRKWSLASVPLCHLSLLLYCQRLRQVWKTGESRHTWGRMYLSLWAQLKLWGVLLMAMSSFIPLILQSSTWCNFFCIIPIEHMVFNAACSAIADLYSSAWELFLCWWVKDLALVTVSASASCSFSLMSSGLEVSPIIRTGAVFALDFVDHIFHLYWVCLFLSLNNCWPNVFPGLKAQVLLYFFMTLAVVSDSPFTFWRWP